MKGRVIILLPFGLVILTVLVWLLYLVPEQNRSPGKRADSQPNTIVSAEEPPEEKQLPAALEQGMVRLDAVLSDARVRIEGISTVQDWQVEGKIIGGYVEAGPNFPFEPAQVVKPGPIDARVAAFIPVRSLKSVSPYSDKMNEVMYEHLRFTNGAKIAYRLTRLVLKELPKSNDLHYICDSVGELVVAGVTNSISMPVSITPMGGRQVEIHGSTKLKMSDFKIEPPSLAGFLTTGDEVKLQFAWLVSDKSSTAASR